MARYSGIHRFAWLVSSVIAFSFAAPAFALDCQKTALSPVDGDYNQGIALFGSELITAWLGDPFSKFVEPLSSITETDLVFSGSAVPLGTSCRTAFSTANHSIIATGWNWSDGTPDPFAFAFT